MDAEQKRHARVTLPAFALIAGCMLGAEYADSLGYDRLGGILFLAGAAIIFSYLALTLPRTVRYLYNRFIAVPPSRNGRRDQ